jgi:hypothetical protein
MQSENEPGDMPAKTVLTTEMLKDLHAWSQRALDWHKKGKSAADWECKALPDEIADVIREKLNNAKNEIDIRRAFELEHEPADKAILQLAKAINNAAKE